MVAVVAAGTSTVMRMSRPSTCQVTLIVPRGVS